MNIETETELLTLPLLMHELRKDRSTVQRRIDEGHLKPDAVAGRMLLFDVSRLAEIKALFDSTSPVTITCGN